MNAEILCIGTELLLGDIVNTNAQYLSRKLAQKGINVFYQSSIGDNPDRIVKSLSAAISRSNLIIITGGLGPTADDITMKTVSDALGIPLERNEEAYEHIVAVTIVTFLLCSRAGIKKGYIEIAIALASPPPVDVYPAVCINAVEHKRMAGRTVLRTSCVEYGAMLVNQLVDQQFIPLFFGKEVSVTEPKS